MSICGAEGGTKYPDYVLDAHFGNACRKHDECYCNPGQSRESCDDALFLHLIWECFVAYPMKKWWWPPTLAAFLVCEGAAWVYYAAVRGWGNEAYEKAQSGETCPDETDGVGADPANSVCGSPYVSLTNTVFTGVPNTLPVETPQVSVSGNLSALVLGGKAEADLTDMVARLAKMGYELEAVDPRYEEIRSRTHDYAASGSELQALVLQDGFELPSMPAMPAWYGQYVEAAQQIVDE